MKKLNILSILISLLLTNNLVSQINTNPENMIWWKEATFGMFIHWGVYAQLGGTWEDSTYQGYAEHIFRMAEIPLATYKSEVVANFNPTKFDAHEWVRICTDAGMKYMVITAKHHDGFAMFDSDVPGWGDDYDIVDATPFGRDPMAELKEACDSAGIKLGFYYSHSQDWSHRFGQRNTWDYNHPTERGWYDEPIWSVHEDSSIKYVDEKSIPQLEEIINKYDPAIIWFDTRAWLPNYYNDLIVSAARDLTADAIFNSRSATGWQDYQTSADKPEEFPPQEGYWEAIPTTNESYGYHPGDSSHKPASHFIKLLCKAAARGGNLLMNVGPMATGEIDPTDITILEGIGNWMKVNGEAIYGVERTTLPINVWGQSSIKNNKLYLHVFKWPKDQKLVVGGLSSEVTSAYILSDTDKKLLETERLNEKDIIVNLPVNAPDSIANIVVLECLDIQTYPSRLISIDLENTLHVFDGILHGSNIRYGKGSSVDNHLKRWRNTNSYVSWNIRTNEDMLFSVSVVYDAVPDAAGNRYQVQIGGHRFERDVVTENGYNEIHLGMVYLSGGEEVEASVRALNMNNSEFMNLRSLILTPVINPSPLTNTDKLNKLTVKLK